jgi:hypothetical protein
MVRSESGYVGVINLQYNHKEDVEGATEIQGETIRSGDTWITLS